MRYFKFSVGKFERISNFQNGELVIMEQMNGTNYKLTTPLRFEVSLPSNAHPATQMHPDAPFLVCMQEGTEEDTDDPVPFVASASK